MEGREAFAAAAHAFVARARELGDAWRWVPAPVRRARPASHGDAPAPSTRANQPLAGVRRRGRDARQDRFAGTVAAAGGYLALERVPHRIPRLPAPAGAHAAEPAPASAEAALDVAGLDADDPATLVRRTRPAAGIAVAGA